MSRRFYVFSFSILFIGLMIFIIVKRNDKSIVWAQPRSSIKVQKIETLVVIQQHSIAVDEALKIEGPIKTMEQTTERLVQLIEYDRLCDLVKEFKEIDIKIGLEAMGRISPDHRSTKLSMSAERELLSKESPLAGQFGNHLKSPAARFLSAMGEAGWLAGVSGQSKDFQPDYNRALRALDELSSQEGNNVYPKVYKAFAMNKLGYSQNEVRKELIDGLGRSKANEYWTGVEKAILDRGYKNATAMHAAMKINAHLPMDDFHGTVFQWIKSEIKNDRRVAYLAMSLGYLMTRTNWFKGEPHEEYGKSIIGYAMGRSILLKAHKILYPDYPEPKIPKVESIYRGAGPSNELYRAALLRLKDDSQCDRKGFDTIFKKQKANHLELLEKARDL